jgi:hypothetical protein
MFENLSNVLGNCEVLNNLIKPLKPYKCSTNPEKLKPYNSFQKELKIKFYF